MMYRWDAFDQMKLYISHGQPCTVAIKVWSSNLLKSQDICVKGQALPHICHEDSDMIDLAKKLSQASALFIGIPVEAML